MRQGRIWLPAVAAIAITTPTLRAQVQEHRLTKADASFPESFSTVRGLRELPDGHILISDGLGQALMVVDLDAGTADTIGRIGGGPKEYQTPDALFPLPGDSTLLVDLGNGRLTVLGPDLAFGETYPLAQGTPGGAGGAGGAGGLDIRIPRGVDSKGRIYYQRMGGFRPGGQLPDSAAVMRWDRATGKTTMITQVKLDERKMTTSGSSNNRNVRISTVPLSPRDGWAVAWDGRVAAARSGNYHVEWIEPDGGVVRGPSNEYHPVRVGKAEREEWIDQLGSSGLMISVDVSNGRQQTSFSRGGPSRVGRSSSDEYEWPDVMPPFDAGGVMVAPDGKMWVERYAKSGSEPTFDVFDANGGLVTRVVLPKGRTIVGFGKGVVYTVTADEFDLQWLERYKL